MNSKEPLNQNSGTNPRKRPLVAIDEPTTLIGTLVAIDHTSLCYRVCSVCEKTLSDNTNACKYCNFNNSFNPGSSGSKRLFRVLMSIATDKQVFVVIMFDRAARVLFGCSADEFFDFAKTRPFAALDVIRGCHGPGDLLLHYKKHCKFVFLYEAVTAGKALEGEMLRVTLSKPKNGNAQHLRVVSVVPLRSGFQSAIETLRELY